MTRHARRLLLATTIAFAISSQAAFFMRLRLSSSQALKAAGGREMRRTEAVVNGREARVSVVGFDKSLAEAADDVRRLWGLASAETSPFAPAAWISRVENGTRQDVLLFQGRGADTCSAWLVESAAEAQPDAMPEPPGGNPLPEAALRSCIEMKDTGSVLTLHVFSGGPAEGARATEAGMAALGWEKVLSGDTIAYFAKDGKAAVAAAYARDGATSVAVLRSGK